jgi:hypothetical protein
MTMDKKTDERLSTADFAAVADRRTTPQETPTENAPVARQMADQAPEERQALFAGDQADDFRGRWSDIQASFVDEPRRAVEQADALVAEVMQRLAREFADERIKLEHAWNSGQETDTEAQRQALRRYRSFFDRLLSM